MAVSHTESVAGFLLGEPYELESRSVGPDFEPEQNRVLNLRVLVLRTGFEPAIFAVRGRCPEPLDDRSAYAKA